MIANRFGSAKVIFIQFVGTLWVVGGRRRFEGVAGHGKLTGTRYTPLCIGADLVSDYTITLQR